VFYKGKRKHTKTGIRKQKGGGGDKAAVLDAVLGGEAWGWVKQDACKLMGVTINMGATKVNGAYVGERNIGMKGLEGY